jgi:hypothetical protein
MAAQPQLPAQQGNRLNHQPVLENRNLPIQQFVTEIQPRLALGTSMNVVPSSGERERVPVIQNPNNVPQISPPVGQPRARTQQPVAANLMADFNDEAMEGTVIEDDEIEMGGGSVMKHTSRNLFYKVR